MILSGKEIKGLILEPGKLYLGRTVEYTKLMRLCQCLKGVLLKIYPFVEICQIFYHTIEGDYFHYMSNKYQNNQGIQASMLYKDF